MYINIVVAQQTTIYAALAQSVARRLGKAEVGGSSPLGSSTLSREHLKCVSGIFMCALRRTSLKVLP